VLTIDFYTFAHTAFINEHMSSYLVESYLAFLCIFSHVTYLQEKYLSFSLDEVLGHWVQGQGLALIYKTFVKLNIFQLHHKS
jgi:hypothetical protein